MAKNAIEIIISVDDKASKGLKSTAASVAAVGKTVAKVGAVIAGFGIISLRAFAKFEDAFAGVRKTVDATEEQFAALSDGIREMSRTIPASVESIAAVSEAAGQLGIQTENILAFTRTMVDLGNATNLSSQEAATALARLANITQLPQDQFDELGSTIVALGNNFATTEREIVEMSLRLAGVGKQIGLTQAEILGMATALSSVGVRAEAGGTAFSRVFAEMANNVAQGGDKLKAFAEIAGTTTDEFARNFQTDAASTVVDFVQGLDRISKSGGNVFKVLEEAGFANIRVRDTLLRASGAGDLLSESLNLSSNAWEENTALTTEAEKRYATFLSRIRIVWNQIKDLAISLGEALAPFALKLIDTFQPVLNTLSKVFRNLPELADLALKAMGEVFTKNFNGIAEIVGRVGAAILENFGNILIEMGAIVLKIGAAIFSPIGVAFNVVGQNIKFGWQIVIDTITGMVVDAAILMGETFNKIPLAPEIDLTSLQNFRKGMEENILDIPQTFSEAWDENGRQVGAMLATIGDNAKELAPLFTGITDDLKAGFGDLADLPEMEAFTERLNEILAATGENIDVFSEETKLKLGEAITPSEEVTETWSDFMTNLAEQWEITFITMDEIGKATWDSFQKGFGDAMGQAVVFGDDFGKSMEGVFKNILAQFVSMITQMILQQLIFSKISSAVAIADALKWIAASAGKLFISIFNSIAAIPFVGPFLAPALAIAGTAAAVSGAKSFVGQAHDGLTDVPREGTFLLDKGERVLSPDQNSDFKDFMANNGGGGGNGGSTIVIENLEIMPEATITAGLFDMSSADWLDLFTEKILPAMDEAGRLGETTTMRRRASAI